MIVYEQDGACFFDATTGALLWEAPRHVPDGDTEAARKAQRDFEQWATVRGISVRWEFATVE